MLQVISLVWGILSLVVTGVAFLPCLGWLNWMTLPFCGIGVILGIMAVAQPGRVRTSAGLIGLVLSAIAVAVGVFRLTLGGGFF